MLDEDDLASRESAKAVKVDRMIVRQHHTT